MLVQSLNSAIGRLLRQMTTRSSLLSTVAKSADSLVFASCCIHLEHPTASSAPEQQIEALTMSEDTPEVETWHELARVLSRIRRLSVDVTAKLSVDQGRALRDDRVLPNAVRCTFFFGSMGQSASISRDEGQRLFFAGDV